eukprot:4259272-Amphidinium_carterae.1
MEDKSLQKGVTSLGSKFRTWANSGSGCGSLHLGCLCCIKPDLERASTSAVGRCCGKRNPVALA